MASRVSLLHNTSIALIGFISYYCMANIESANFGDLSRVRSTII